jgi:hypothetical protein
MYFMKISMYFMKLSIRLYHYHYFVVQFYMYIGDGSYPYVSTLVEMSEKYMKSIWKVYEQKFIIWIDFDKLESKKIVKRCTVYRKF